MFRYSIICFSLIALAGCAPDPMIDAMSVSPPGPAAPATAPNVCDIRVDFGSSGSGIDSRVYSDIMAKVLKTPSITEKHIENIGFSGERTLCLTVAPDSINTVFNDLKNLIPPESQETWTRIVSRDGQEFKTQPYAKFTRDRDWRRN